MSVMDALNFNEFILQELKSLLDTVGKVSTVDVRYNKRGRSLGNAIVEFSNPAGAQAAIVKLNDTELGGRVIQVRQFFQQSI